MTAAALAGGLVALIIVILIDPGGHLNIDITAVTLGILAGIGLDRLLRG
jgi:hypothetical protein